MYVSNIDEKMYYAKDESVIKLNYPKKHTESKFKNGKWYGIQ